MVRVLVVDDSAFSRNLIATILTEAGHEVVGTASNGIEAIAQFKRLKPELVTLDYLMPDRNGESVIDEIIAHAPEARIIMISGSGDPTLGDRAVSAGAKFFLDKHDIQRRMLQVIDQVMAA